MSGFFRREVTAPSPSSAERRLRELYGDVDLGGVGRYRERTLGDDRFALSEVVLDGEFEVAAEVAAPTIGISSPGYRWRSGDEDGLLDRAPAMFQPQRPMASRLSGPVVVTTVTFDPAHLADLADATFATPTPLHFDGARPVSAAAGRAWAGIVRGLLTADALDDDLVRATTYRLLAASAFELFRLAGDHEARSVSAAAGLAAYRRAARFIDESMSLPISEADVARASGIALQELRLVFRANHALGWTPLEYLRRARLSAAHLDLVDGDPTLGDRVASIAARWGFRDASRFARLHREVYGVNPRWVLDR